MCTLSICCWPVSLSCAAWFCTAALHRSPSNPPLKKIKERKKTEIASLVLYNRRHIVILSTIPSEHTHASSSQGLFWLLYFSLYSVFQEISEVSLQMAEDIYRGNFTETVVKSYTMLEPPASLIRGSQSHRKVAGQKGPLETAVLSVSSRLLSARSSRVSDFFTDSKSAASLATCLRVSPLSL